MPECAGQGRSRLASVVKGAILCSRPAGEKSSLLGLRPGRSFALIPFDPNSGDYATQ